MNIHIWILVIVSCVFVNGKRSSSSNRSGSFRSTSYQGECNKRICDEAKTHAEGLIRLQLMRKYVSETVRL